MWNWVQNQRIMRSLPNDKALTQCVAAVQGCMALHLETRGEDLICKAFEHLAKTDNRVREHQQLHSYMHIYTHTHTNNDNN